MEGILNSFLKDDTFIQHFERYIQNLSLQDKQIIFIKLINEKNYNTAKKCLGYLETINFGSYSKHETEQSQINPLINAAYLGNLETVKFLVENYADIDHLSDNQTTAIMYAFQNGHMDVVKYLYDKGAKIKIGTKKMTDYIYKEKPIKMCVSLIDYLDDKNLALRKTLEFKDW